jgi:hypothetical protein
MKVDRNETNDVKLENLKKFNELIKLYDNWASKYVVVEATDENKVKKKEDK